jgi:hypothetical protein
MTLPDENVSPQRSRSRRLIIVIGVVIPLVITLAGAFVMALWIPELPNPVATHWGAAGPDGYSTVGGVIALPLLITLAFAAFAAFATWRGGPNGGMLWAHKILVATSVLLSVLITVIAAGSLAVQRGLDNAESAPGIGSILLAAIPVAALMGVLAWLMLPAAETIESTSEAAQQLTVCASRRLHGLVLASSSSRLPLWSPSDLLSLSKQSATLPSFCCRQLLGSWLSRLQ